MRRRFSAYGFLKNQRYFEPFIVLAFLERGCDFTQIGILVAVREVVLQALEIPSGALADATGRRRVMVLAFTAYVLAYLLLGAAGSVAMLAVGMGLLGFADAFRTGTHKAMLFDWLDRRGRSGERVEFYGYTRSWSKIGSAVSIPIAAAIVLLTGRYAWVFWLSAVPAALDLLNLGTYPRELDGDDDAPARSVANIGRHLREALRTAWRDAPLRRLLGEAMSLGGTYKATKDYLQPLIVTLAVSLPAIGLDVAASPTQQSTAVATGAIYVVLALLGAAAARWSHRLVTRAGGLDHAAGVVWIAWTVVLAATLAGLLGAVAWIAIAGFVAMAALHDLFRPTLVSRIVEVAPKSSQATVLSLESQATSLATIVVAPLCGWWVDRLSASAPSPVLWPVAAVGLALAAPVLLARWGFRRPAAD